MAPAARLRAARLQARMSRASGCVRRSAAFLGTATSLRKNTRQALERLGRLLKTRGDLIGVGPRRRVQALRQREQRLLAFRVRDALDDAFPYDAIPLCQERDLFVRRLALDLRRDCRSRSLLGLLRLRSFRRHLAGRAFPRASGLGCGLDNLLIVENRAPVELDVR